ncbi:MAG: siderophore-iron reductase FhuF [Marinobacter sp.]|uniref:siderophore-iron reductase FhuF n=1 Tax=Marinobacter sp. TaxID=50741 RepID=UPI003F965486
MTIPVLSSLFTGDLKPYGSVLVLQGQDQREGIPATDLVSEEGLRRLLCEYQKSHSGDDQRALISLWSKHYFAKLIVPVAAANLIAGHELPVALDKIEVIMGEGGVPAAFRLPHGGQSFQVTPENPFERFRELMDNNFSPLIDGWCDHIKISRRVLWSNAATYFERLVRSLEAGGVPHQTLADGRQLIELNKRPSGHLNPMANPVRYVERGETCEPLRQRRLCCIRYRLPGLPLCGNCPHIDRPPKGALLPETR